MTRLFWMFLAVSSVLGCALSSDPPKTPEEEAEDQPEGPVDEEECPSDEVFYEQHVDPWIQVRCGSCHASDGAASASGFHLNLDTVAARYDAVAAMAEAWDDEGWTLLLKPTDLHSGGHGGGQVLSTASTEYEDLVALVGRVADDISDCGEGSLEGGPGVADCSTGAEPGPRVLQRLSHTEYGNTVRDLLGTTSQPELAFAIDNSVGGFLNSADALQVSSLLMEQYRTAAEALAEEAVVQRLPSLVTCDDTTMACAAVFVEQFGRRVFRRPLTEQDRAIYLGIFEEVASEDGFSKGVQWVITAMLQSPHFLYRSELGERQGDAFVLTGWEIATEMSYLVLQTTPDDALLDAAGAGVLSTDEGRSSELARLMATGGSATTVEKFVGQWLHLNRLGIVAKDDASYPELTPSIRALMDEEARRLISEVYVSEGTMTDLMLAEYSFMTSELAGFYGMDLGDAVPDAEGFARVDLTGSSRGGLLNNGALLTVHALPSGSSPIHRGVLIREQLLCQDLPPPPANIDASPPEVNPSLSTRERYAAHADVAACSACHDLIDPIGFAFEHFDGVGRWRETEGPHVIDSTGEVVDSMASDGIFDGTQELSELLVAGGDLERCYAEQWVRFGTGLDPERGLACSVPALADTVNQSGGRLDSVFNGLSLLPHFTKRVGTAEEQDGPQVGTGVLPIVDDETDFPEVGLGTPGGTDGVSADVVWNDWGTGYCVDVTVHNLNDMDVVWEVVLTFEGTIDNVWNAVMTDLGGSQYAFSGDSWNVSLLAGETTEFGLCAYR